VNSRALRATVANDVEKIGVPSAVWTPLSSTALSSSLAQQPARGDEVVVEDATRDIE